MIFENVQEKVKRTDTIPLVLTFWGTGAVLFFTGDFISRLLTDRGYSFISAAANSGGYLLANLFFLLDGYVVLKRKEGFLTRTIQQWTGQLLSDEISERLAEFEGRMMIICVIAGLLFGLWNIM